VAITGKQERNGVPGPDGFRDSATGPVPDVAPLIGQAQSAGTSNMLEGHAVAGVLAGHTVSFEWDAGLAIDEQPGEA
jgi:hypothetical protein